LVFPDAGRLHSCTGFNWGPTGAFISIPLAETAIAVAAWIIFKKGRWKKVVV